MKKYNLLITIMVIAALNIAHSSFAQDANDTVAEVKIKALEEKLNSLEQKLEEKKQAAVTPADAVSTEKLNELEQRQKIIERQLEIEREAAATVKEALAKSQSELAELKKAQTQQATSTDASPEQITQLIDARLEAKKADFASPEWVKNMQIKGDFRYRFEGTDDESKSSDRNRSRIRARVGVYGKASDEFDYGFRMASGNNESPTSTNQDLGNSFSSKELWLDLAYFDYHPKSIPGLNVFGGKIKNPYYTVGNSDLMFDTDVNPEGIAVTYSKTINDKTDFFGAAGAFYVEERSTEAETSLWGFQGGIKHVFDKEQGNYVTLGGGYYDYGNLKGTTLSYPSTANFFGNTTSGGNFASDFDVVQGFAEYGFKYNDIPVKLFGDYAKNIASTTDKGTAYLAGATVGNNKKAGDWLFGYNYRDVEADSIVGVLAEATFGGGGTDVRGHKFSLGYQLSKNVNFTTSYMIAERTRNDVTADHNVLLADLVLKF
ncbi:MAG: putative porin [Phycisphaerae bacterium]|nr:putative porin [Phycisphaerae bacterium]